MTDKLVPDDMEDWQEYIDRVMVTPESKMTVKTKTEKTIPKAKRKRTKRKARGRRLSR